MWLVHTHGKTVNISLIDSPLEGGMRVWCSEQQCMPHGVGPTEYVFFFFFFTLQTSKGSLYAKLLQHLKMTAAHEVSRDG